MIQEINSFIRRSVRVLKVSYRPRREEFWMIAKVTGLGMVLIGLAGFLITVIFTFVNSVS